MSTGHLNLMGRSWRRVVGALALGLMGATAQAHGGVYWSVNVNAPVAPAVSVGTVFGNSPYAVMAPQVIVQQPVPVYAAPRPVYMQPAPAVIYAPAPVRYDVPRPWWGGGRHHHHDDDRDWGERRGPYGR